MRGFYHPWRRRAGFTASTTTGASTILSGVMKRSGNRYEVAGETFDALILTPPVPQSHALLASLGEDRPLNNTFYRSSLSVMLGYAKALPEVEKIMIGRTAHNPRADIQRPSMAQDMKKGRKTEIEFMNGFIAAKGKQLGIATPANEKLVQAVLSVETGKVKASAAVLGG